MELTALDKVLSGLDGGVGLIGNALQAAHGTDTAKYQRQIDAMAAGRGQNFFDNTSLLNYQQSLQGGPDVTKDDLNPSVGQSTGNVLSSTLNGAMTGLSVGGGWGALAGAVIGLGTSLGSDIYGRRGNEIKADILNQNKERQVALNSLAIERGVGQARDYQFNQAWSQRKAEGGKLKKKQLDLQEFAEVVMNRQQRNDRTHSAGITRRHGEGGTIIRIKR